MSKYKFLDAGKVGCYSEALRQMILQLILPSVDYIHR